MSETVDAAFPVRDARRSRTEWTKDAALWVTGVIGTLALLWFVAAQFLGVTVVIFRTGSMAPSMPQGAGAVSIAVSASDLEVGDVVTVSRSAKDLPITHRIVSIETPDDDPLLRTLVLKGDDNPSVDREPYTVDTVTRVVFAVPGLGAAVGAAQRPVAIGTITACLAALITWGLWPTRQRSPDGADPP